MSIFLKILIVFSLFLSKTSLGQKKGMQTGMDSPFVLIKSFSGDIVNVALDNLDNIYLISSTGSVKKLGTGGDSLGVYNQVKNSGQPYSIDVSNPLKILLFYKDFSTVVVLDRYLAVRTSIDLRRKNILQPGAVALSYDNNIWVFDEYDNKLKKIDEQGNLLLETPDLRSALNQTVQPQRIINDDGSVYLTDTTHGVFVFDNYGSFRKKLAVNKWQSIEISRTNIVSIQNGFISIYNPTTFVEKKQRLPAFQPYLNAFTHSNKFVLLSKDSVQIYRTGF